MVPDPSCYKTHEGIILFVNRQATITAERVGVEGEGGGGGGGVGVFPRLSKPY